MLEVRYIVTQRMVSMHRSIQKVRTMVIMNVETPGIQRPEIPASTVHAELPGLR